MQSDLSVCYKIHIFKYLNISQNTQSLFAMQSWVVVVFHVHIPRDWMAKIKSLSPPWRGSLSLSIRKDKHFQLLDMTIAVCIFMGLQTPVTYVSRNKASECTSDDVGDLYRQALLLFLQKTRIIIIIRQ